MCVIVIGRVFGFLLLGLYGGLTKYSCDLYAENCPYADLKQKFSIFDKYTSHSSIILACLLSAYVIFLGPGSFPLMILALSVISSFVLFKFKST